MQATTVKGFHLSRQQTHLWSLQQLNKAQYHLLYAFSLQGSLDTVSFLYSLQQLVNRHEILRTAFSRVPGMDIPLQIVSKSVEIDCPILNLENLSQAEQSNQLAQCFLLLTQRSYVLDNESLLYTALFRLTNENHSLLIGLPTLCADSASFTAIINELGQMYTKCDMEDKLAEEPLQYTDFSAWQNDLLASEQSALAHQYWLKIDLAQLTTIQLPFEKLAKTNQTPQASEQVNSLATQIVSVDDALFAHLQTQARHYGLPVSSWLLTCWCTLLQRLSDTPLPLIGVDCAARNYDDLTHAIGPYAHTIPLSIPITHELSFEQIVTLIDRSLEEANKKQIYFSWDASVEEDTIPSHFFPLGFGYEVCPDAFTTQRISISFEKRWRSSEPLRLKLLAFQNEEHLQLTIEYSEHSFAKSSILYLTSLFTTMLQSTVSNPTAPLSALPLLNEQQQRHIRSAFSGSTYKLPEVSLQQLFEEQVQRTPRQLAVLCDQEALTYQHLNQLANQLAHLLRQHGIGPNMLVGLCAERSVSMLVGLLAILKAGGAYMPLDPRTPASRLLYQLQQSQAKLLLTQQHLSTHLAAWTGPMLYLEASTTETRHASIDNLPPFNTPDDLAYVIYTSGSTGLPKGVMIRHHSLVNYTLALCHALDSQPGWHYATVSTLAADLGNTAIFCALTSGGCLQILTYEMITSAQAMADWMALHPIDVLKIVPSHLSTLLTHAPHGEQLLPQRALILGGEALPWSLVQRVRSLGEHCAIYNHYGPTETTIGVLINPLDRHQNMAEHASVPLGRPLPNTEAYVLDNYLQLVPTGITGELFLGGSGLAQGYLSQQEQTAESFIPHPWSNRIGERLYRTGDLVYTTDEGTLAFVGRRDQQLKVRGYRIEPGEIEALLRRHPQIWDALVIIHKKDEVEPKLIGYIVPRQPEPGNEELRNFLSTHLPDYMLPDLFISLKELPLNRNGKVDRSLLPDPETYIQHQPRVLMPPRNPLEEILLDIWKNLLALSQLSIHDNFFQLGGHSLLATQVIARIRSIIHVDISILSLFEAPTIAELARLLQQTLHGNVEPLPPALVPAQRSQELPLSFAQQRLWFLDCLAPETTAYLIPMAYRLHGIVEAKILEKSLQELIQRHESLRTIFQERNGRPVQIIRTIYTLSFPYIDLSGLAQNEREHAAHKLTDQEAQRPCNLSQGPLLRVLLLRLTAQEHLLLLTIHHIISDGWSNDILFHELTLIYQAFHANQPSPLPPLPLQYADFALWQRQWLQGEVLTTQLDYWKKRLESITPLDLPTDYPYPPVQNTQGALATHELPETLSDQLMMLSQREGTTLFMTLLTAFQILLARYTGQTDIAVGTPIANRTHEEIEGLIGFFVNTLVLRSDLSGNPSFLQLLGQIRHRALEAYIHQNIPFEYLVEAIQPERDLSRSSLFQVMFSVVQQFSLTADTEQTTIPSLTVRAEKRHTTSLATKFDLELNIISSKQGLHCGLAYRTDLFTADTAQRLLAHFQILLESIVAQPEQAIMQLPLLTLEEQNYLLSTCNKTQQDYPHQDSFAQLFARQVLHTPESIALSCNDAFLTYQALDEHANRLAHILNKPGIEPECPVGLLLERSPEMLIALLAVFKIGGAYIPLDLSFPTQRLASIIQQSGMHTIITRVGQQIPSMGDAITVIEVNCEGQSNNDQHKITLNTHPEQLAYIIYTSGSTGQPKGAMVTQRGMVNHLFAKIATLQLKHNDIVAQTASHCFDISVWQLLAALLVGGQVRILPDEISHDPLQLSQQIQVNYLSIVEVVPSMLRAMLENSTQGSAEQIHSSALRWIIATGEALSSELASHWLNSYPQIPLVNAYGPTECSDDVTHAVLHLDQLANTTSAPIGQAIANTQIYLLDDQFQPVPLHVAGQIYIGGAGVGRGYLKDPAQTASVFLPDPFALQPGSRLYKSGDIARYRGNAQLEFLHRIDAQVKLRGYRIELGEIEAVLCHHPAIREAIVVLREDQPASLRLIAYLVYRKHAGVPTQEELYGYLRDALPHYMLPTALINLDALPLTENGKVNRAALPEPTLDEVQDVKMQVAIQVQNTPIEELLQAIWSEVLRLHRPGLHDNFFTLGGHSLLATQVISRIRGALGVDLPLRSLFEAPTIAELTEKIKQALQNKLHTELPPLLPAPRSQPLPLSFAQQRLWFIDQLEPGNIAYTIPFAVRLEGPFHIRALEHSLQHLLLRHESLRTVFRIQDDQPVQVILEEMKIPLPLLALDHIPQEHRETVARQLMQQVIQQPFDLTTGPLLRILLLRLADQEHVLLIAMQHIISDGWSMNVLAYELGTLYKAFVEGTHLPLTPLPIQYADFAVWQRQYLQGEALATRLKYWARQLGGYTMLQLPTDHPHPSIPSYHGADCSFTLSATLSAKLIALSQHEGVTLFMTLLAAFQTLLYHYTGQHDILVGTDMANRTSVETEKLIGFFINLLALRNDLSGAPSFRELLQRTREMVLAAYAYQDTPFEMLVELLHSEHSQDRMPLIQTLFVLQNQPATSVQFSDLFFRSFPGAETKTAKFDLAVFVQQGSQEIRGTARYNRDLFEARTIELMMERFTSLLHTIITHPDSPIDILGLTANHQQAQVPKKSLRALRSGKIGTLYSAEYE